MNLFISIMLFLNLLFLNTVCSFYVNNGVNKSRRFTVPLGCSTNEDTNPINSMQSKTSNIPKVDTFKLAKEYHNFLVEYNILSNEEISKILIENNEVKLFGENNSVKVAKHRLENYLIFEKNWYTINQINKNKNIKNLKLGINRYADSIEFGDNNRSNEDPPDLMEKEIKKNFNLRKKLIVNSVKKFLDKVTDKNFNIKKLFGNGPEKLEYIDWSKSSMTTKVKDQKQCGSCWAQSAIYED